MTVQGTVTRSPGLQATQRSSIPQRTIPRMHIPRVSALRDPGEAAKPMIGLASEVL